MRLGIKICIHVAGSGYLLRQGAEVHICSLTIRFLFNMASCRKQKFDRTFGMPSCDDIPCCAISDIYCRLSLCKNLLFFLYIGIHHLLGTVPIVFRKGSSYTFQVLLFNQVHPLSHLQFAT